MRRTRVNWCVLGGVLLGLVMAVHVARAGAVADASRTDLAAAQSRYPRVRAARARVGAKVAKLFAAAGAPYPARVFLRGFKEEGQLELWAFSQERGGYVRVATYPFLGYSGDIGPKRRRWDRQIPEGFYRVSGFNGASRYHLSIQIDYPNASDRILGNRRHPGNNIFIHGNEVTDGCIPIGDTAIERVYVAVLDARAAGFEVPVHLFPCRFGSPTCQRLLARASSRKPKLSAFWSSLREGFARFEAEHLIPDVSVDGVGRYVFGPLPAGDSSALP